MRGAWRKREQYTQNKGGGWVFRGFRGFRGYHGWSGRARRSVMVSIMREMGPEIPRAKNNPITFARIRTSAPLTVMALRILTTGAITSAYSSSNFFQ